VLRGEKESYQVVYIFIFSVIIEFMQFLDVTQLISGDNKFLMTVFGASFSFLDIACYAVGCIIIGIIESITRKRRMVP